MYIGRFHKLSVHAMSALDVTMTKIARANQNDIDDISLCARHGITSSDIINAARSYGIDTPELRNNLRRVLHRVFGIATSELEEDRR